MHVNARFLKWTIAIATAGMMVGLTACGSSSSSSQSSSSVGTQAASGTSASSKVPSWCGPKKVTIALADGTAGNAWREQTALSAQDEAAKCPSVTKFIHTDGQGSTQKAISDMQGLVAQGINAIVTYPDAGPALLPVLTQAFKAGVVTVPYWNDIGGKAGVNYTASFPINWEITGAQWGKWMAKELNGHGNWVYVGGTPDDIQNIERRQGMESVLKNYPGIKQIGPLPYVVTNWDPAQEQKQLTAVLAKYPTINAIAGDFGEALGSSLVDFQQAHRTIPALLSEDNNSLGCAQKKYHFPLYTMSTGNWIVRGPIDYAIAKATGGTVPQLGTLQEVPFEDSTTGQPHEPMCDASLPASANLSSQLPAAQLKKLLG